MTFRFGHEDRVAVRRAIVRLRDLSVDEWPYLTAARAIGELVPSGIGSTYRWRETFAAEAGITSRPSLRDYQRVVPTSAAVIRKYSTIARAMRDPHEGRAAGLLDVLPDMDVDARREIVAGTIGHFGAVDQIRVSISSSASESMGFFILFEPGVVRDEPRERARLAAIVPTLRNTDAALRACGSDLGSIDAVTRAIDLFDEAAWLFGDDGRLLHINAAAVCAPADVAHDARVAVRFPLAVRRVRSRRLRLGDRNSVLVLSADRSRVPLVTDEHPSCLDALLPRSLVLTARLACRGGSVVAIARATGRTVATTRMYLQRIYRHLGVRSRAELIADLSPLLRAEVSS